MALTKITGEGVGAVDDVTIEGHASVGVNAVDATRALTVAGSTDDSSASGLVVYNSSLASKFSVRNDGYITAAGDIQVGGSLYVGGTAAANALDDYEEGTWTPTVGGTATYTAQEGHYTKIGDLVHARCTIVINSIGSGATTNISGLPFTCKSGTNGMGQINVGYWSNFKTNTIAPGGFVAAGTTTVYFTGSDASASSVDYPFDFIQNGTRIDYDLTYRV